MSSASAPRYALRSASTPHRAAQHTIECEETRLKKQVRMPGTCPKCDARDAERSAALHTDDDTTHITSTLTALAETAHALMEGDAAPADLDAHVAAYLKLRAAHAKLDAAP